MNDYVRNRSCHCVRCRAHDLMGAAVLITLGVLFLLHSNHILHFGRGVPALLLVIGCVLLVARTGSTEGHVGPVWTISPQPQQWTTGVVAPPPISPPQQWRSGESSQPSNNPNDPQVKP